jgi:hypothetical protein
MSFAIAMDVLRRPSARGVHRALSVWLYLKCLVLIRHLRVVEQYLTFPAQQVLLVSIVSLAIWSFHKIQCLEVVIFVYLAARRTARRLS